MRDDTMPTRARVWQDGEASMPYKTKSGSHYHMTPGCHGADIPCDTTGLIPCSDCCGGQQVRGNARPYGGGGYGGTGSGYPGAGSMPAGFGAYPPGSSHMFPLMSQVGTTEMAEALQGAAASGLTATVTKQRMPSTIPTELIAQMLSSGLLSSIDFDTTTGVVSFKLSGAQQGGGQAQATVPGSDGGASGSSGGFGDVRRERDYGYTDTRDAMREIRNGTHNSMERYLQPDGTLTPEREAIHRQIIDKVLNGKVPVDGQAVFRMLGGGPASGKSSVIKAGCVDAMDEQSTVSVDADAMKEELPGYADMAVATSNAAAYYHEEASALGKRIMRVAMGENYNVTLDGTGNGSVESVRGKIAQARRSGYKVTAVYVTVDIDTAIERNRQRYARAREAGKNPRLVPAQKVVQIHKGVSAIFPQVAADFDEVELYDNSGPRGSKPVLIARGGSGEPATPTPGREREYFEFLNKK